jgi:glycine dehydrogenase subunit 1
MTLLGETGFKELAALNHARACQLADRLSGIPGVNLITPAFFNEFALKLPKNASEVVQTMADAGVLGGVPASRLWSSSDLDDVLIVAATETNTNSDIDALVSALEGVLV